MLSVEGEKMTKAQIIQWLRTYIDAEKACRLKRDYRVKCEEELKKYLQKPKLESESKGFFEFVVGVIFCTVFYTVVGAIVVGGICAVIWCIWMFVEIIAVDYKNNSSVELMSQKFLRLFMDPVINAMNGDLERPTLIQALIAFLIIGAIISFILSFITSIWSGIDSTINAPKRNQRLQQQYEKNLEKVPELRRKWEAAKQAESLAYQKVQSLERQHIVAEKYLSWASDLLQYLEDGRADSLKEAINLMEFEWNEEDRMHELRRHNRQMEEAYARHTATLEEEAARAADASERAAEAAEEGAFWSKGSTFLIANEIDKLKKK